jgi:hypothetical protein
MTRNRITARNRANARKSTGPKTSHGKAIVAGNARRHGATAQPPPESIAVWLAIILDRPGLTPDDVMLGDETGYRALMLAQAEVRLVATEQALLEFEAGQVQPTDANGDPLKIVSRLWDEEHRNGAPKLSMPSLRNFYKKFVLAQNGDDAKRHRLLKRYVREASAQRRKALAAWAATASAAMGRAKTDLSHDKSCESRNKPK